MTPTEVTVIIENETQSNVAYDAHFSLERNVAGRWRELPVLKNASTFSDEAYQLEPGGITEYKMNWGGIHGTLPAGKYRIVKAISKTDGIENAEEFILTASFNLYDTKDVTINVSHSIYAGMMNEDYWKEITGESDKNIILQTIPSGGVQAGYAMMATPDIDVEVTYGKDDVEIYHLWLAGEDEIGSLMSAADTHIIYTVPGALNEAIIEMLEWK